MKARIVIGANFGDEGKGLITDYLCSQGAGMVVRFNGGAQAGHTVVTPDGKRHVFRHFGSGSFLGVPTFLSHFFICNPILFMKEFKELYDLGLSPLVYAHPDCLVSTFADMMINQHEEDKRAGGRHGSCGVGIHETIMRSKLPNLKITVGDLWNGSKKLGDQMLEICDQYFRFRTGAPHDGDSTIPAFMKCCEQFAQLVNPLGIGQVKDPVFEGAQGLLLDQDNKEFFPHVTHSSTGMKNVDFLCHQARITEKDIYYVSRTYLTRHGAGPLPGEDQALFYEDDTNFTNDFQGTLRFANIDSRGLLDRCVKDAGGLPFKLALTHEDQCEPNMKCDFIFSGPTRNFVSQPKTKALV